MDNIIHDKDALIEAASSMWAKGIYSSEIAKRLGVRKMVIIRFAFMNREKFPRRPMGYHVSTPKT